MVRDAARSTPVVPRALRVTRFTFIRRRGSPWLIPASSPVNPLFGSEGGCEPIATRPPRGGAPRGGVRPAAGAPGARGRVGAGGGGRAPPPRRRSLQGA